MRAITYIDGFNLYHGLREGNLRRFYWLDLVAMSKKIIKPPVTELVCTKYFTSRIDGAHPTDAAPLAAKKNESRMRQTAYLDALATLTDIEIIEGQFLTSPVTCRKCGHSYRLPKEKMTDVNIATALLMDAFHDRFDVAYVISGDSDLAPPIEALRSAFSSKIVRIGFPPNRQSNHLKCIANGRYFNIGESTLKASQLPDSVTAGSGATLTRPAKRK